MFRRDWLFYGSLAGLILAALIAVGVYTSLQYQLKQTYQRQNVTPTKPYTARDQQNDRCASIDALDKYLNCLAKNARAEREENRAQYDLEAQQDMALWAYWILWISGIGLLVTAAGVVYVARTLHATRETLDQTRRQAQASVDANQITRAGLRPWIDFQLLEVNEQRDKDGNLAGFIFAISQRNVGKTLASDGRFHCEVYLGGTKEFPGAREVLIKRFEKWDSPGATSIPNESIRTGAPTLFDNKVSEALSGKRPSLSIAILYGYKSGMDGESHYTLKNYIILWGSMENTGIHVGFKIEGRPFSVLPDPYRTEFA